MFEDFVEYLTTNKEWIFSGVGPWIIGGVITAILATVRLLYVLQKKKALSIIRIEKSLDITVIEVDPDIRPEIKDKLKITYEDQPIDGIYELIFTIHNLSENPIKNITLSFCFENLCSVDFLEIELTNEERIAKYTVTPSKFEPYVETQILGQELNQESGVELMVLDQNEAFLEMGYDNDSNVLALHLPYLNPWRKYEDYLGVTIFSPKRLLTKSVVGKGVGWRTTYIDRTIYHRKLLKVVEKIASLTSYIMEKVQWYIFWR